MRYSGIKCTKCGIEFNENDDVVVCPVCGAPHHRQCWLEEGNCTKATEHTSGFQWSFPEDFNNKKEEEKNDTVKDRNAGEFVLKNGESVIVCPNCGALNCENDAYCMRCRTPLKPEQFNQYNNGNNYTGNGQQNQQDRMFSDFNRFGGLNPDSSIDGIPVIEYSDFIGGKAPGRIVRKISTMERFGKNIQICWPALFLGPVWFFWRKMKKEGIIISAILLALCISTGLLQINEPLREYYKSTFDAVLQLTQGEISAEEFIELNEDYANIYIYAELTPEENVKAKISSILGYLAEPGIAFACSLSAMYFYRKKIKQSVLDIRTRCTSMTEYRDKLRDEGGVSFGWGAVGAVLYFGSVLLMSYLPALIIFFE